MGSREKKISLVCMKIETLYCSNTWHMYLGSRTAHLNWFVKKQSEREQRAIIEYCRLLSNNQIELTEYKKYI